MRQKKIIIFTFLLLVFQTINAQIYSFKEIPQWVKTVEIPDTSIFSKYDITSGFYYKLCDYQINLETNTTFNHEVLNVVSYSGITEASQLSISLDSSYQNIEIHHLYIWRRGEKIDYTEELDFEIMKNDYSLQDGIYTGIITLYSILEDIRKDDLIDFSYSLIGDNPIFNNEKYLFIPLASMSPIDLYSVRVLYGKNNYYNYECIECDSINFETEISENYNIINLSVKDIKPFEFEYYMPEWVIPYKYFTLSSFNSWKEVNDWAQDVFALEKEPELNAVFEEIFTGEEEIEEKINKLIDYVQDDIRYMGIETGIGSIKPFHPEKVVKQRYGDCKDKSLLLVSLLKQIGVDEAYPVLVNTTMLHKTDQYLPSNEVFDHCIVTFNYNDTTYWIDPTISQQGGNFKNLYCYDYGKALVIGQSSDSLQIMDIDSRNLSKTELIEELTISSFTEPANLKITSTRYGFDADYRRSFLEYYSINELRTSILDELKNVFPDIKETNEVEVIDEMESNELTMIYNYEVDDFWQDGDEGNNFASRGYWLFVYKPLTLYSYLFETVCEEREYEYQLAYPLNMECTAIFNFPKEMLIFDEFSEIDSETFYFQEKVEQISSKSFQVNYIFEIKEKSIKPDSFIDICQQVNSINNNQNFIIYFNK